MILIFCLLLTGRQQLTPELTGIHARPLQQLCFYNTTFVNFTSFLLRDIYELSVPKSYESNQFLLGIRALMKTGIHSFSAWFQGKGTGIIILNIHIVVVVAFMIFFMPFMTCLCLCENIFPPKKCRTDSFVSDCDRYWSLLPTGLAGATIIVCVLLMMSNIVGSVQSVAVSSCRVNQLFNSVVFGKITSDKMSYFSGLVIGSNKLKALSNLLPVLNNLSISFVPDIDACDQAYINFTKSIDSNFINYANPTYNDAFYNDATTTSFAVASNFKETFLGPFGKEGTILNSISSYINGVNRQIAAVNAAVKQAILFLNSNKDQMKSVIQSTVATIGEINNYFELRVRQVGQYFDPRNYDIAMMLLLIYCILGLLLTIAFLLNSVGLIVFEMPCCKLWGSFIISLFFAGFIFHAGVTFILGLATPSLYTICRDQNSTLNNATAFANTLRTVFMIEKYSTELGACMAGGSFLDSLGSNFSNTITQVRTLTDYSQNYTIFRNRAGLNATMLLSEQAKVYSVLQGVYNASILDFTNPLAIKFLSDLSTQAFPKSQCNDDINLDWWVPNSGASYKVTPNIGCPTGSTPVSINCSSLASPGCPKGCFGFTQQFANDVNQCVRFNCSGSIASDLNTRYGVNCRYSFYLKQLNINFDKVRQQSIQTLTTAMQASSTGAVGCTNDYLIAVNTFNIDLASLSSYIYTFVPKVLDNRRGVFAGFNCTVLQAQARAVLSQMCGDNYSYLLIFNSVAVVQLYAMALMLVFGSILRNKWARNYTSLEMVSDSQEQVLLHPDKIEEDGEEEGQEEGEGEGEVEESEQSQHRLHQEREMAE